MSDSPICRHSLFTNLQTTAIATLVPEKTKEVICISFLFLSLCICTWCYEVKKRNRYQNLSCQCSCHWAGPPTKRHFTCTSRVFDCDLHYPTHLLHILANLGNTLLYSHKGQYLNCYTSYHTRLRFVQISHVTVWNVAMHVQRCWY